MHKKERTPIARDEAPRLSCLCLNYIFPGIFPEIAFHFSLQNNSTAAYDKYLRTFLQDFYVAVIKLIDKSMRNVDTSVRGLMAAEIHKHMHICNESAKKFLGREFQLYKVILFFIS